MEQLQTISLPAVDVSRCGEIFVTSNADKWTFFCSYCQKATNDIGVFICHIRLEHLNNVGDFQPQKEDFDRPDVERGDQEMSESQHVPNIQDGSFFRGEDEQETQLDLIKEETNPQFSVNSQTSLYQASKVEDVTSLADSNETESVLSDKNDIQTYIPSDESNDEFVSILPTGKDSQDQEFTTIEENNEPLQQVIYKNDDEIIDIDDNDDENIEEIPDSDVSNENTADGYKATGSAIKNKTQLTKDLLMHECQYCLRSFKSIRGLHFHKTQVHNEKYHTQLKHKCKLCKKGFRSAQGLRDHLVSHDKNNVLQCPICPVKKFKISFFLTHIMKHESDKCFPCQSCGKIYKSNEERFTHWQTHSKEKPYSCDACYRRFRQKHYLIHHLKKHGQYSCYFCPQQFVTTQTLRIPYVCPSCEKLPDIKEKIKNQKLLVGYKNTEFDSDEE